MFISGILILGTTKVYAVTEGMSQTVIKEGYGGEAKSGDEVAINYTGKLLNGTVFDSSIDARFGHVEPFNFILGAGHVIKGFDIGVSGMKIGEKRRLVLPPSYGYGSSSVGSYIPANSTLIFDVELMDINQSLKDKKSITVLYPNGGETFYLGDKINIKWKSNNIPTNAKVAVYLEEMPASGMGISRYGINQEMILNDGSEYLKLNPAGVPNKYGKYFKIAIVYSLDGTVVNVIEDTSNNYFTLKAPSASLISQCLADKGAVLYTASWCSHCQSQKEIFGDSYKNINHVECSSEIGTEQLSICDRENITGYPTWKFGDGSVLNGTQTLEALSEKAGCNFDSNNSNDTDDADNTGCSNGEIYSSINGQKCHPYTNSKINITYPRGGEVWSFGNDYRIKWNTDYSSKVNVALEVEDGDGAYYCHLGSAIGSDGKFSFNLKENMQCESQVNKYIKEGKYRIYIYIPGSGMDSFSGQSEEIFIVKNLAGRGCSSGEIYNSITGQKCSTVGNGALGLLSPKTGDTLKIGQSVNIIWKTGDITDVNRYAHLVVSRDGIVVGEFETPNDGKEKISIPFNTLPGKYDLQFAATGINGVQYKDYQTAEIYITSDGRTEGCIAGQNFSSTTGKPCANGLYKDNSNPITRTLKRGVTGDDVKRLQEFLQIYADGVFGRGTAAKVKEWQLNNGLYPDGSFGPKSRATAGL